MSSEEYERKQRKTFNIIHHAWKSIITIIFILQNENVQSGNLALAFKNIPASKAKTMRKIASFIIWNKKERCECVHSNLHRCRVLNSMNSEAEKNTSSEETEDGYIKNLQDETFNKRTKHWVVLVDDEESIRLAVGDYLYDMGYQVTACADADALLEALHFGSFRDENDNYDDYYDKVVDSLPKIPDIIISDVRMPGKDGLELVKLIRSDERLSRVPVILLTAKSLTQDRILGYQAGADVYLPKPFDPDELLSIVDNAILRRAQMTGDRGKLMDLKDEMTDIKVILRSNAKFVVKETDVYLTPTEREVLELLCKGFSNAEIAEERKVSKIGVNRYIQTLYAKTETRTRTELVRWAIKTGQISRD